MTPFFSIIVPTYNRAHTLGRCIDSIINQTYDDWELIIIDDGSTDGTEDLIKAYTDTRIKYIWQENQERSVARNHGVSLAKGEWICFQDSDDEYLPEHLEVLRVGITANVSYKILRTGLNIFIDNAFCRTSDQEYARYDQYPYEALHCYAFRRHIMKKYYFEPKYSRGEDFFFLYTILKEYQFYHIKDIFTVKYNYDPTTSYGFGPNYRTNLMHHDRCVEYVLKDRPKKLLPYLRRKKCQIEMLRLNGDMKYNRSLIANSLWRNVVVFCKFPKEYLKYSLELVRNRIE